MKKNKKIAKLMLKETGLKLRGVSVQPENLLYVSIYHDICALANLKQYKLVIGMCKCFNEHLDRLKN